MPLLRSALVVAAALAFAPTAHAQEGTKEPASQLPASPISCASKPGETIHCPADTSGGVVLLRSIGSAQCILGKTWGYDDESVWVTNGCSAEFLLGQRSVDAQAPGTPAPKPRKPTERIESWGDFEPGQGFLIGRGSAGELAISGYALLRYVNQMPAEQTFTDHLGNERTIDPRNDLYAHRIMVFLKGWIGVPKLVYNLVLWTVNTTDQDAIFATIGYQFTRRFSLYGGLNGNPGTRSLQGSHPF